MTTVTSPSPASTRCCKPAGRRPPTSTPTAVPASTAPTLMNVPVTGVRQDGTLVPAADVLIVSLGSTAGLRAADAELADALRRAGATVEVATAAAPRELRTYAL